MTMVPVESLFTRWALDSARDDESEERLVLQLVEILADALPLVRVALSFRPSDPTLWALNVRWEADLGVLAQPRLYDSTPSYAGSAVEAIFGGAGTIRERLETGSRFPLLEGLARQKATDYLIQPIELGRGVRTFVSYATAREGGFTEPELQLLERIHLSVASLVRLRSSRLSLSSLLRAYLGHNASQRVLSGTLRRGHGEQISAAIWFCDLRGFTVLSQTLSPERLLCVLDDYFQCVALAVTEAGGEILKFIGDAMLAIFPAAPSGPEGACAAAAEAAIAALARFETDVAAAHRSFAGEENLGMGLSLHFGDVFYGNIGARDRLDFTVIGASVNLAARVQGQCTTLRTPLLMTGEFAAQLDRRDLLPLGSVPLKGIAMPPALLTLASFAPPAQ